MPYFQFCFFFKKFRSFQLFSFQFGGLSFFFQGGNGVFEFHFSLLFCFPCDGFGPLVFIVIFFFKKTIHFVNFGGFFVFFKFEGLQFFFFIILGVLIFFFHVKGGGVLLL